MALFKPRTVDDRRANVVFRDPMFHGSELDRATRKRVNKRSNRSMWWIFPVLAVGVLLQLPSWLSRPLPFALGALGAVIVFTALFWFFVLPPLRQVAWNLAWKDRFKQVGRCPACQYDLSGLEPDTDACTVCPECAGAWRLPGGVALKNRATEDGF